MASRERKLLSSIESHLSTCSVISPDLGSTLYSDMPVKTAVGFHGSSGASLELASMDQRDTMVSGSTTPMSSNSNFTSKTDARKRTFRR